MPPVLKAEGERMAAALLRDLTGEAVVVLRDARLGGIEGLDRWRHRMIVVDGEDVWPRALREVDAVWPIAPESAGVLARYSTQVLQAGKVLLGASPEAVAACGDKLHTVAALDAAGVSCVPSWPRAEFRHQVPPPWVVKPVDGVGCDGVTTVNAVACLPEGGDWIVQPYVAGEPLSLSAVFDRGEAVCVSVNRQRIVAADGGLRLLGCEVNVAEPDERWQRLCRRIAAAFPGLWGYVGIDLIQTRRGPLVVEINPRLTLSYAGLRSALGESLAAWIVAMASEDRTLGALWTWRRRIGRGKTVWVAA